jgi:molybdopterin-binding protein
MKASRPGSSADDRVPDDHPRVPARRGSESRPGAGAEANLDDDRTIRIGQAAELLGVSVETIRRWEADGRLTTARSGGGQRRVAIADVSRLLAERRRTTAEPAIVAQSARNRFAGIVTSIRRDEIVAQVEVIAGPHRLVSLMTAEAVDELQLRVGDRVVCVVKATQVIVEVPSPAGREDGPRCRGRGA